MTGRATLAVRRSILVSVSQERAFEVFTRRLSVWWPQGHHIGSANEYEPLIEPREGGRWYERGADGSECDWGRVLRWEPPRQIVLAWQISPQWTYDPDLLTEVEVRFIPEGPDHTRVELELRGLEAYGEDA